MYQNIILAYDGSLESQQALLNCKDLSQWEHAKAVSYTHLTLPTKRIV